MNGKELGQNIVGQYESLGQRTISVAIYLLKVPITSLKYQSYINSLPVLYEFPAFSCRMYFQNNYYMSELLAELPLIFFTYLRCWTVVLHCSITLHRGSPSPTEGFLHSRTVSFLSMKVSSYLISGLTLNVCLSSGACILNVFSLVVVLRVR